MREFENLRIMVSKISKTLSQLMFHHFQILKLSNSLILKL